MDNAQQSLVKEAIERVNTGVALKRYNGSVDSFLLDDFLHSLSALKVFLTKTFPNLSGIEDEFI